MVWNVNVNEHMSALRYRPMVSSYDAYLQWHYSTECKSPPQHVFACYIGSMGPHLAFGISGGTLRSSEPLEAI